MKEPTILVGRFSLIHRNWEGSHVTRNIRATVIALPIQVIRRSTMVPVFIGT
jgi:hypothetical protein